jgi:hypothetical protein
MVAVSGRDYLPDEAFDVVREIGSLSVPECMARELLLSEGPFVWDDERFEYEYVALLVAIEGYLEESDDDSDDEEEDD